MNNVAFLSYFPDLFDVKDSRYFLLTAEGEGMEMTPRQLSDYIGPLVTYEPQVLVDDFRRAEVAPPKNILSVDDALRLSVGRARDDGGERLWSFWKSAVPFFPNAETADSFKGIVQSKTHRPEAREMISLLEAGAHAVRQLWEALLTQMRDKGELERFLQVDVPVQQIFFHRQFHGIQVDSASIESLLRDVAHEKYQAYSRVANIIGRSPNGLNFWNIHALLAKTDASDVAFEKDGGRLRELLKLIAPRSQFARDYLTFADADRDESILRRAFSPDRKLHPVFRPHGTVTGRILVADPHLQQLRRKYRSVLTAERGRRLQYLDYAQFEPGILAFLANDDALIRAYNAGDIYEALSEAVYGTADRRALSKRIFLAYSYGMSTDRIAKLVLGSEEKPEELAAMESAIGDFFATFPQLRAYRQQSQEALTRDGFIGSLLGNRRWRSSVGTLTHKEARWAMNQPVQATASLIFKEALISLSRRFDLDAVLVPMHDAVLLQLPEDGFEECSNEAAEIMAAAYAARCPGIVGRITRGSFAG